jgi:hypothetical protein
MLSDTDRKRSIRFTFVTSARCSRQQLAAIDVCSFVYSFTHHKLIFLVRMNFSLSKVCRRSQPGSSWSQSLSKTGHLCLQTHGWPRYSPPVMIPLLRLRMSRWVKGLPLQPQYLWSPTLVVTRTRFSTGASVSGLFPRVIKHIQFIYSRTHPYC